MRTLALDYGKAKIGVAISDELGIIARPVKTIRRRSWETDLSELREIIESHNVARILIGMPITMNGTRGRAAQQVETFIRKLEHEFNLPIVTHDERLSTVQAEELLIARRMAPQERKQVIDSLAAAVILQEYLDSVDRRQAPG